MGGMGLMYYNARWYDPYLNHFTQPDSIIPGAGNPQAWNRYAYVLNNPLKYTDPSGNIPSVGGQDPLHCGPDNIYCGGLYGEGSLWDQLNSQSCPPEVCERKQPDGELPIIDYWERYTEEIRQDVDERVSEAADSVESFVSRTPEEIFPELKQPIKPLPRFNGGGTGTSFSPFLVD